MRPVDLRPAGKLKQLLVLAVSLALSIACLEGYCRLVDRWTAGSVARCGRIDAAAATESEYSQSTCPTRTSSTD